jgi:serine/threonine protein kinase
MNDPMQTVDEPERQPTAPIPTPFMPHHIGRYRIDRVLGKGGFGLVYLAYDDRLQRLVAIKVPHRKNVDRAEDAEAYLSEARTVANLDHPHIVPVFDVGSTEDCPTVSGSGRLGSKKPMPTTPLRSASSTDLPGAANRR